MAHKRMNNEGTLYYREDRRRWCAQVSLEGRRLTKYASTQRECREWVKETLAKIDHGLTFTGTQITLERFVETWLSNKKLSTRPGTVHSYQRIAERDFLPSLGKMLLKDILPGHIKQLYANMQAEGKGARTIQLAHVVLHSIFRQAVREGILGRNPMEAVQRPRVETAEFQILNEEQARQFMIFASESPHETLFHLALTSGMRKGELLGLKWTDVDWTKGVLNVQRQLQTIPNQGYALVAPKSKAGYRQIKLGLGTLRQLEAHQKRQELARIAAGERWQEHGLIFTTSIGTYCDQTRVSRELKRVLKAAGLPDIRFHDLRHTSISFQLEMGTSLNTVQRRAGHSKASVTSDIYGHTNEHSQDLAAEKIEELITPIAVKLQSK
jgi:integrase